MKKKKFGMISILLVAIVFIFNSTLNAQPKTRQFSVKSGHVDYKLTGNTTGTKSIWWDDWGHKTRTEEKSLTVTKIFGIKSEEEKHLVIIMEGANFWHADLLKKTGQTGVSPFYDDAHDIAEDVTEAEAKELEKDILDAFGGERLPNEKFMGYDCEVIKILGAKVWVHKGVTLKSEAKIFGIEANELATKFEKDINIPASKFEPLSSINYEEIPELEALMNEDSQEVEDTNDNGGGTISYPFSKFKQVINSVKLDRYRKLFCKETDGEYITNFIKGLAGSLSVMATSMDNADYKNDGSDFEDFSHNGKKCHYGKVDDSAGTSLIVEYPKYNMFIIFMTVPGKSKADILLIADKFNF